MTKPSSPRTEFDPTGFLEVGRHLRSRHDLNKEARIRSAIGRGYYALFLAARRATMLANGRPIDDEIDHGKLRDAFFSAYHAHKDTNILLVGKALDRHSHLRKDCDYKLVELDDRVARNIQKPDFAKSCLAEVSDVIDKLGRIDLSLLGPWIL